MSEHAPALKNLHTTVGAWHGTGRYKYENGKVVDILAGILTSGGLNPYADSWDQKRPGTHSVSLARERAYARLYASLFFPARDRNISELWKRFVWSWRYLVPSLWAARKEYGRHPFFIDYKHKTANWIARLSRKPQSLPYAFLWGGTDMAENYPILIGVREGSYMATRGSNFVDLHEDRSSTPITLSNFTHLEVPSSRFKEVRHVLDSFGCALPLIRLEKGDVFGT